MDFGPLPDHFIPKLCSHKDAGFSICYFKNKNHFPDAPAHHHVIISLKDGTNIVVCIVTSQVQKRASYYERIDLDALDSLVPLDPTSFRFITTPCVIDCNKAELLTHHELTLVIDKNVGIELKAHDGSIDIELKQKVLQAIYKSPVVKPHVKSALRLAHSDICAS
jgi:hypothetical protein